VGQDGNVKASVIIPTRNRADLLAHCLESLTQQTLPADEFEVLVIDNGSSDQTPDIVRKYAAKLQLSGFSASEPGLHVGRHIGLRNAQTEILIFADDDIEAQPTWIEAIVETFQDPKTVLVGGNNYPNFQADPPEWLLQWWQQRRYSGHFLSSLSILDFGEGVFEIDPGYVWGCNFSIRRNVLLEARGFHPDGVPAERLRYRGDGETHLSDFVRGAGLRAVFNSRASVRHLVSKNRMTRAYFEQRAYAQGISDSYSIIRRSGGLRSPMTLNARRKLRLLSTEIGTLIRSAMAISDPIKHELCAIRHLAAIAYRAGYQFHRKEVHSDPALLNWVLKPDYLD
jgi:glycosyltransferase involved in cell wall biosynthesis